MPNPISAIRVRVAGIDRFDSLSLERVRTVAEAIESRTGLQVDITFGSSQSAQTIVLPAGTHGRPQLRLTERWSVKGVATRITQAVDRKSEILFGLILVVCVLFLGNAATASVRDRRSELAILACLGWPARRLFATTLGEVGIIGLFAGALAYAVSVPLGHLFDAKVTSGHALLAVPVAIGLTLLSGLLPAARAAGAHPGEAVRPAVTSSRRAHSARGLVTLAIGNLLRVPGRTLLGVLAMAVAVCAMTLVAAVLFAFHGAVTGTMLGDAVTLKVRSVDTISVVTTTLLAALAIADVLYLNVRERAAEIATLEATGWTTGAVRRMVSYEGLGMGVVGSAIGFGVGLAGAAWFAGGVTTALVLTGIGAAGAGTLLTALAAVATTLWLGRVSTLTSLAEE